MKSLRTITRNSFAPTLALVGLISLAALAVEPIALAHPQEVQGSWIFTGNLNTARDGHTATLLQNGKLLIAGGGGTKSAEVYDPVTETWSRVGNLNSIRSGHTATLLSNGKVLVAGGYKAGSGALSSAELYDPDTDAWSPTSNLNTARFGHTATLLQDGKLLVVGGDTGSIDLFADDIPIDTAEMYDPDTGRWSFTGKVVRDNHTATLLQSGKVLVAGGGDPAELYDPGTGTWSSAGDINGYRYGHTATLLPDGRVLVAGGAGGGGIFRAAAVYDPDTGTWSNTGNLNTARFYHTATLLPDGKVLVAGGVGTRSPLVSSELYDPDTGTWSFTSNLNTARSAHTATLLPDGKVLVAGGGSNSFTNATILDSVELGFNFSPVDIPTPAIIIASPRGRRLFVLGENFDLGAVILLNGEEQQTINDGRDSEFSLIGRKVGQKIKPGDKLQVRNTNGVLSQEFTFTGS